MEECSLAFSEREKQILLDVKGVGPTVIKRFEEIGIDSLAQLSHCSARDIAEMVANMLGTSCWKNSPQALAAVEAAIARAKLASGEEVGDGAV